MVIIRDRGLPPPAGAILISPWVDLTHSFPSVGSHNPGDYLPPNGFRHRPSQAWPPPNADELATVKKGREQRRSDHDERTIEKHAREAIPQAGAQLQGHATQGYSLSQNGSSPSQPAYTGEQGVSDPTDEAKMESITVSLDGQTIVVKDQIQMYATNQLMAHPLVSPVLQPSLGGLPPLFVLVGGGEMLRDEQFYTAHKAANPAAYAPSDAFLDEHDPNREILRKYEPTYVHLQVWDNLCHVAPALSFTAPAKHMFRAIAQFGAWALARGQNTEIDILDDEDVSPVPSDNDSQQPSVGKPSPNMKTVPASVGRAGDPLPAFYKHMIRQRVNENGHIYPLDAPSSYPVLQIPSSQVGSISPILVKKWISGKKEWDQKFAKDKLRIQEQRIKELAHGLHDFNGESPPPSSLAARRAAPGVLPPPRGKKNYPMFLWSLLASKHDKLTMGREDKAAGVCRRRSVDATKTGTTDQPMAGGHHEKDPEKPSVARSLSSADIKKHASQAGQVNYGSTLENIPDSPPKLSGDKPMSPLLVLPDDDDLAGSVEENASTRAVFRSPLPMTSQVSLSASNCPTAWTVRSDDVSSVDDTGTNTGLDGASSRAVVNATGVVGPVDRPSTASRPGTERGLGDSEVASSKEAAVTEQREFDFSRYSP